MATRAEACRSSKEVLAKCRDAAGLLETLPQISPDRETVALVVGTLRARYQQLTRDLAGRDGGMTTTADLLALWRDASRAAERALELAKTAVEAAEQADARTLAAEEIASLAERAAETSDQVARLARAAADEAAAFGKAKHAERRSANADVSETRSAESDAADRYHEGEARARGDQERPREPS